MLRNIEVVEEVFRKTLVKASDGIFAALGKGQDDKEDPQSPVTEGTEGAPDDLRLLTNAKFDEGEHI